MPPAVILGCLTSIRVIGPLAGLLIVGFYLVRRERRSWWPILIYGLIAVITLWITWPYLWDSPFVRMVEVILHMANNPQILPVLFNYEVYLSTDLPRVYMPIQMAITLTEPVWPFFIAGLGVIVWKMLTRGLDWRSLIWVLAWFFVPVLYVLGLKPPMYDNFRHFLFILPPVFIIAGFVFQALLQHSLPKWIPAVVFLIAVLPGIYGILTTHPYEYAYYNNMVGGLNGVFRRFETDYWLTCYKDLVPQLKKNPDGPENLYVLRQPANAGYYAPGGFLIKRYEPDEPQVTSGDYLLLTTRSNMDLIHQPEAPVVLQVEKNGAVLCVIKQIP
jgi:MFS family permease